MKTRPVTALAQTHGFINNSSPNSNPNALLVTVGSLFCLGLRMHLASSSYEPSLGSTVCACCKVPRHPTAPEALQANSYLSELSKGSNACTCMRCERIARQQSIREDRRYASLDVVYQQSVQEEP